LLLCVDRFYLTHLATLSHTASLTGVSSSARCRWRSPCTPSCGTSCSPSHSHAPSSCCVSSHILHWLTHSLTHWAALGNQMVQTMLSLQHTVQSVQCL